MKLSIVFLIIALAIYATEAGSYCGGGDLYCGASVKAYDVPTVADGTALNTYPKDGGCSAERTRVRDIKECVNAVTTSMSGQSFQYLSGITIDMTPRVYCDTNVLQSPSQSNYSGKYIYATPIRYDGAAVGTKKEVAEVEDVEAEDIEEARGGGKARFYGALQTPGLVLGGTTNVFSLSGSIRDSAAAYHTVTIYYHTSTDSSMTYLPFDACDYLKAKQAISTTHNWKFTQKVRTSSSGLDLWNDTDTIVSQYSYFGTLECNVRNGTLQSAIFLGQSYQRAQSASNNYKYFDYQEIKSKLTTTKYFYYNNSATSTIEDKCTWACVVSCPLNGCGNYTLTGTYSTCKKGSTLVDINYQTCSSYVYCGNGCSNSGPLPGGTFNIVNGREIQ
jgi:hypothetical protein